MSDYHWLSDPRVVAEQAARIQDRLAQLAVLEADLARMHAAADRLGTALKRLRMRERGQYEPGDSPDDAPL